MDAGWTARSFFSDLKIVRIYREGHDLDVLEKMRVPTLCWLPGSRTNPGLYSDGGALAGGQNELA